MIDVMVMGPVAEREQGEVLRKDSQLSQLYIKITIPLLIDLLRIRCCLRKFYGCFAF